MALSTTTLRLENNAGRNVANFEPSIYGDYFTSFIMDVPLMERYNSEVDALNEQVKTMFVAAPASSWSTLADQMSLIDTIERLGLSYQFDNEIEQHLEEMFTYYKDNYNNNNYDLYTVSLHFRIFRQHGHFISTDVFTKFTGENGKFMETLSSDITGMLSLYEAAHLRIHGEDILEEALSFTRRHLNKCSEGENKLLISKSLAEQVAHALDEPLHRALPRLEARSYISVYQQRADKIENILKLAKIDFNRLQMLQKQELRDISWWWRDILVAAGATYVRDRIVEGYFWCAGAYDAPKYSLARAITSKVILAYTMADDTYDAYGTYEELQTFTEAWQRWEVMDTLPEYMKPICTQVMNMYNQFEADLAGEGRSYGVPYAIEGYKEMTAGYGVETHWLKDDYVPTFDEYMKNELLTSMDAMHTTSLIGMGEHATLEALEWVIRKPKIVLASSLVLRLLNDIAAHEHEHDRKHIPTGIACYMKQYNVSKEETIEEFNKMIEDGWKDINEEMLRPTVVSRHILMAILNLLRNGCIIYKSQNDGYTKPQRIEKIIRALHINPIPVDN